MARDNMAKINLATIITVRRRMATRITARHSYQDVIW